jgi:lysophospholipase L1-like esterase
MFGDSWPYGAHCNGCQPFPFLLDVAYAAITGLPIDFQNDTTNGGTAQELAAMMRTDPAIRGHVEDADIIVIAIGGNDLEPAFNSYKAGNCGGRDRLDCFRTVAATLRTAYDGMLTAIDGLRAGRPTAVRMVTTSNEFLSDQSLIETLGADFGTTSGVTITQMDRDAQCEVAVRHHAVCVDLGAVLNGPDLMTPNDVNTQATMQQVADAIAASGLLELGL